MRNVFFVALLLGFASGSLGGTGALDPTFGAGGRVFTNVGISTGGMQGVKALALQADGKIVAVGTGFANGEVFAVARYHADGTPDTAFGVNGLALGGAGQAMAVALQADGKIVVAGGSPGFVVARYNTNGSLDQSFGTGGRVATSMGTSSSIAHAVRIQADGRIVAAGEAFNVGQKQFAVARYTIAGSLDATFNGTGVLTTTISIGNDVAFAIAIQADGMIVLGGHGTYVNGRGVTMIRLAADGTRDMSFGSGGTAAYGLGPDPSEIAGLALQADGKIVAAGPGGPFPGKFAVSRFHPAGTPDYGGFNPNNGYVLSSFGFGGETARAVAIQANGKIVTAGLAIMADYYCGVMRHNADGSLDAAFPLVNAGFPTECNAVAIQADGRIVAAGRSGERADFALFRFLANGTLDAAFGTAGKVKTSVSSTGDTAQAVALQADGKIVTAGTALSVTPWRHVVARHAPGGDLDSAFAGGGVQTYVDAGIGNFPSAVAIQADGKIVAGGTQVNPGPAFRGTSQSFQVLRYDPAGALAGVFGTSIELETEARAMVLQPDGKIVLAGRTGRGAVVGDAGVPNAFAVARFEPSGALDPSFNVGGRVTTSLGGVDDVAYAAALQADGRLVVVGKSKNGAHYDMGLVRYTPAGAVDALDRKDIGNATDDAALAVSIQADGRFVVGGSSGSYGFLARFTAPGAYDTAFAIGGKRLVAGGAIVSVALQPDGRILALTRDFHVLRFDAAGMPDTTFGVGGRVVLSMGSGATASALLLQADGRIVVVGSADNGAGPDMAIARIDPAGAVVLGAAPARLDFGGQLINTTSAARPVIISNTSGGVLTVTGLTASAGYAVASHTCATLPVLATCWAQVTFTPTAEALLPGLLSVATDKGPAVVSLDGAGERSLVSHYYRSILQRDPDAGGKAFWENEAARVSGLGANVNETWYALAQSFYFSGEYAAFGRSNSGFATDLYATFFNRAPDPGGLSFWVGRLDAGLPREVALASFMFSAEFAAFSQAIFGNPVTRAEIDMIVDFYRGLLARLPDDGGFNFWVGRFRAAQCAVVVQVIGQPHPVVTEVEAISSAFTTSGEYAARNRTTAQYVGDLYNAFLRRGGDLGGVQFWINQIDSGARTRENVRIEFKNSPEFQARVNAVVNQGCMQ